MQDKSAWLDGFMPLILHIGLPYILVSTEFLSFSYHRSISFFYIEFPAKSLSLALSRFQPSFEMDGSWLHLE